jgi:hypothetical protein
MQATVKSPNWLTCPASSRALSLKIQTLKSGLSCAASGNAPTRLRISLAGVQSDKRVTAECAIANQHK